MNAYGAPPTPLVNPMNEMAPDDSMTGAGNTTLTGTLTGEYIDHGDPPWRWYLLKNLERRPDGYPGDAVWCLAENLFIDGES